MGWVRFSSEALGGRGAAVRGSLLAESAGIVLQRTGEASASPRAPARAFVKMPPPGVEPGSTA